MNLYWFISRTVRHAEQMRKHVWKILNAQRDILSPQAITAVEAAMQDLRKAVEARAPKPQLQKEMENLENAANKWLKAYPHSNIRENVEVLLVAIAVAMGIRTFFLQPFKIPTGSMQPTLYGVTSTPDYSRELAPAIENFPIPNPISRFFQFWIYGIQYKHVVAKADGVMETASDTPKRFLLFNWKQEFYVGGQRYTVYFPPDNLLQRAGLVRGNMPNPRMFRKGEDLIRIRIVSGDHLFVDRLSYNFRRPNRGDIVVFETKNILGLRQDQFYIKRLVGLGGETVRIGNDRHVIINNTNRLDASTPHFEAIYSFNPAQPPRDSVYSGHVNQKTANEYGVPGELAPLFIDQTQEFKIDTNYYMVFGDNTVNSLDSRSWGAYSRTNVIGRSFFVYWPIGAQPGRESRFGWGQR